MDHADAELLEDVVVAVEDVKMPISNIQIRLIRRVNEPEINQESISIKSIPEQDYHSQFNMRFKIVRRKEKSKQNSRPQNRANTKSISTQKNKIKEYKTWQTFISISI